MIDFKLPVEFPALDLSSALPLLALVVLTALIVIALTARALIQSRAFSIALVVTAIILGSSTLVGGVQSLALLIGVAGVVTIGVIVVLGRTPDVLDLLHTILPARPIPPATGNFDRHIEAPPVIHQLPSPPSDARPAARAQRVIHLPQDWGF